MTALPLPISEEPLARDLVTRLHGPFDGAKHPAKEEMLVRRARVSGARMYDDRDLLQLISTGDREAMRAFYERYNTHLFAFLRGRGADPAAAADAAQDTMLEVWRSAGRYRGEAAAKTWLFSIARNKLIDRTRKNARLSTVDEVPDSIDEAPDPEAVVIASSEAARVRACLGGLKPEHLTVIRLAFYEDLTYGQISEIEGVPTGTVKTRVYHAKKLLLRCLGKS